MVKNCNFKLHRNQQCLDSQCPMIATYGTNITRATGASAIAAVPFSTGAID